MDTQELNLETLSAFFHLPISEAAKEIGVCTTVLKKICRKYVAYFLICPDQPLLSPPQPHPLLIYHLQW